MSCTAPHLPATVFDLAGIRPSLIACSKAFQEWQKHIILFAHGSNVPLTTTARILACLRSDLIPFTNFVLSIQRRETNRRSHHIFFGCQIGWRARTFHDIGSTVASITRLVRVAAPSALGSVMFPTIVLLSMIGETNWRCTLV